MLPHVNRAQFLPEFAAPRLPPVIGHRGAAARAPENTLAGLRRAKELGCEWVEFDVRLTADGMPVLLHDATIDRTSDGSGKLSRQTFAEIQRYDAGGWFAPEFAGERVPALEEALLLCARLGLGANIEIKGDHLRQGRTATAVEATLKRLDGRLPPLLLSCFQLWPLTWLRQHDPPLPRGALFRIVPFNWALFARRFGCGVIGADHRRLRRRRVAEMRKASYQIAAYTVNDPARARLLYAWGVTSVFSDVPDIILKESVGTGSASAVVDRRG